jgi:hypothetical protein
MSEVQSWPERKAEILAPGSTVIAISAENRDRREAAREKKKRAERLRHAQSRDRLDASRGLIAAGATPNEDKLRAEWKRQEEKEVERAEREMEAHNLLEEREAEARRREVEAEADRLAAQAVVDAERRERQARETRERGL